MNQLDIHRCRVCCIWYTLDNFHKNKNRKKGIDNECKSCKNKIDTDRYIRKRKTRTNEEKIRHVFNLKKIHIHSEGFNLIYKRVMNYIDSIPDHKWNETVNKLLQYKYNAKASSVDDCYPLLGKIQKFS